MGHKRASMERSPDYPQMDYKLFIHGFGLTSLAYLAYFKLTLKLRVRFPKSILLTLKLLCPLTLT